MFKYLKFKVLCSFPILHYSYFIIFILLLINSCNLITPNESIPSYISINSISYKTNISGDYNSQDITDAWVYVDDQLIGAFQLPAKFPVLITGSNHQVKIMPGVELNGIAATRAAYPFYTTYDTIVNLPAGKVVKLNPRTTYVKNISHPLFENFENRTNLQLIKTERSLANISAIPYTSLPTTEQNTNGGRYAGLIRLNSDTSFFEIVSDTSYVLSSGVDAFLELDYCTNDQFTISIQSNYSSTLTMYEIMTVNPSATWQKIYVNLTPFVSGAINPTSYKIYMDQSPTFTVTNQQVLLDNIKLITYN